MKLIINHLPKGGLEPLWYVSRTRLISESSIYTDCNLCRQNETLRLFPPVTNIPKWAPTPQPITYKDKTHILPAKMLIHLNASCVHRNPLYWILPGQTEEEAAINSFKPKRWFAAVKQTDDFDLGDNDEGLAPQGKDTSRAFFRPHKGSFIPFSEGSRACLGRKFANVEFVATLMVLFRYHSIELDVREGETYEDAKRRGWDYVKNSRIILTLKPNGREPGIRCVPRGRERWFPKRD